MPEKMTYEAWLKKGARLFGRDRLKWKFVCPSCGHIASVRDWKDAGAPSESAAFSCVGRWTGGNDRQTFQKMGGPCTYAGGGLLQINPVTIVMPDGKKLSVFAFVEPDEKQMSLLTHSGHEPF